MIDPAVIIARAAAIWHVAPQAIRGPRRFADLMPPRQAVAYVLYACGLGVSAIGRALCRDHTTIISSIRAAELRMRSDRQYAADVAELLAGARSGVEGHDISCPYATVRATVAARTSPALRLTLSFWGLSRPLAA